MEQRSYLSLRADLGALSPEQRRERFELLQSRIAAASLADLHAEERYEFAYLISLGGPATIEQVTCCPPETRMELTKLYEVGKLTVPRIQAKLFLYLIQCGQFDQVRRTAFSDGPCVIFVVPPTSRTLGLRTRGQRGANPPVGIYSAASLLDLFGVHTRVFDLDLGQSERDEFEATVKAELARLWFVSFSSRFVGAREVGLLHDIAAFLDGVGDGVLRPRLIGGSIGPMFFRDTLLKHTPVEVVSIGYAELSLADMIFDSDYEGPRDRRPAVDLFRHIPNLAITYQADSGSVVCTTARESCPNDQRHLLAAAFDISKVPYSTKYWPRKLMVDICSPDDLNMPEPPEWGEAPNEPPPALHPANYVFKPRQLRYLSLIGNCPRNCRFCHWRAFDDSRFVVPYPEMVSIIRQVVRVYPQTQMVGWLDEDFLLWKPDLVDFLRQLREDPYCSRIAYCFETLPHYIRPELLPELKKAGFKAILLGLESPVERVLRDMRKLHRNESYETFISAPRLVHNAGFFTRCSTITFYPDITEPEVAQTIRDLTDLLDYGISVEVYPYVMALGGSEYAESAEHTVVYEEYTPPNGSDLPLRLPTIVLPDDPVVRQLAQRALAETPAEIKAVLAEHQIEGDYPMSLGVLGYFRSIIKSWQAVPQRLLTEDELASLERQVEQAIQRMVVRHFTQRRVQQVLERRYLFGEDAYHLIEGDLSEGSHLPYVWLAVRMALDFGDDGEVLAAAWLAERLARNGHHDRNVCESLETRLAHPVQSIHEAALAAIKALTGLVSAAEILAGTQLYASAGARSARMPGSLMGMK